jgi:hypothetical protein
MKETRKKSSKDKINILIIFSLVLIIVLIIESAQIDVLNQKLKEVVKLNNDLPRLMDIIMSQENLHQFCESKGYYDMAWVQTDFWSNKVMITCYLGDRTNQSSPQYSLEELFEWWKRK